MRHGKKFNHLGRTSEHRNHLLINLSKALLMNKRIVTTLAKAKALRKYVERIITKSKVDSMWSRRIIFSYLQDKEVLKELFNNIASVIKDRPGGYTRIIKLNNRLGDNASMAMIELVDYNELYSRNKNSSSNKKSTRRGKKRKSTAINIDTQSVDVNSETTKKTEVSV